MSGGLIAAAVIGAGSAYYSGQQSKKAANKIQGMYDNLEYKEDPNYKESQTLLKGLGSDLIAGNIPEYYKNIGQAGGTEFENMLSLIGKNTQKTAMESAAASGGLRGGNLAALTAGTVADNETNLRYQDFARALIGKQNLLNLGVSTTEGVRNAAFGNQSNMNDFSVNKTGALADLELFKADSKAKEVAGYASALTSLTNKMDLSKIGSSTTTKTPSSYSSSGLSLLGSINSNKNQWIYPNDVGLQ
jgi:hypothetical protein